MGFERMAPWDAMRYFDTPLETVVTPGIGAVTQLCKANPMRVVLILACTSSAGTVSYTMNGGPPGSRGIPNSPTLNPIILTHADHGPLVQYAWFCQTTGASTVTVYEVVLHDWPEDMVQE